MKPTLAVTMGDPAGIGPEVVVKAASVPDVFEEACLVVFGDAQVLARAAREMAPTVRVERCGGLQEAVELSRAGGAAQRLAVVDVGGLDDSGLDWAHPVPSSDRAQYDYIQRAFEAVRSGAAEAMVTAPVSKVSINRAGVDFPGHTEMLAGLCGVERPVMMLAGPTLKVVPLTTHVPLRDVPRVLTTDLILHGIRVTHDAFRRHFRLSRPRIALAGLNPHAGDGGLFGDEEARIIEPAVEAARAEGISVSGPFPGDSVFHRAVTGEFDVVLGMYHDQALVPLKLLDFDRAVNVTLGLPIVRTSVDHGTAYDIAGGGVASASSMIAATRLAARMVRDARGANG